MSDDRSVNSEELQAVFDYDIKPMPCPTCPFCGGPAQPNEPQHFFAGRTHCLNDECGASAWNDSWLKRAPSPERPSREGWDATEVLAQAPEVSLLERIETVLEHGAVYEGDGEDNVPLRKLLCDMAIAALQVPQAPKEPQ